MALVAGTRLGAYEFVTLLGAGGMGEVYKARDTRLPHRRLKILPAGLVADPQFRAHDFIFPPNGTKWQVSNIEQIFYDV